MADFDKTDENIIDAMQNARILVVGDIMLDRFVYGNVDRISPESPVPVLSISRENAMLGGAGNTLSNLVHLGCKAAILSVVGDDDTGKQIKQLAKEQGIDINGLILAKRPPIHRQNQISSRTPTTPAHRF